MKRKILSLALALCLCASYLPTTGLALAEEPDPADAVETPAPTEAAEEPVEVAEQPTEEPEEPAEAAEEAAQEAEEAAKEAEVPVEAAEPAQETEAPAEEPEPIALEDVPMAIANFEGSGGNGSEGSPYEIANLTDLKAFRDYIDADEDGGSGEYFKLTASIDLGGSEEWTPIGMQIKVSIGNYQDHPFQGTFDGCNFTISGVYINTLNYYSGLFGQNSGTIKNLIVSGNVANGLFTGGIVGQNNGSIKNCYYSGTVHGDDAGGIAGSNKNGSIENCYNIGTVSNNGGPNVGGIVGLNSSSVSNCYYLNTCGAEGVGTAKTAEEFKSGEVAWLLQNGQDTPEQVWGQKLGEGGDNYPVFTSDTSKKVLKVTFATQDNENYAAKYTNPNGTVEMPENPEGENFTFKKWVKTQETNGEEFEAGTPITEDMTVYAVGSITSGATGECHLTYDLDIYSSYGYEVPITANLDECMKKAFEIPEGSEGSFTYVISDQSSLGDTVATIEDNILTIPTGPKSGEYTITVTATEKTPQYSLMSLDSDSDLTLNVKFGISKLFEKTPVLSIDYVNETLIGFEIGASYTLNLQYVFPEDGKLSVVNYIGRYVSIIKKGSDENHSDSTSWSRTLPTRPAAPVGPTGVAPTTHDGNGKITGTDTTMEYREKTDGNTDAWKDCTAEEFEVAPNKTYEVRAKAVPDEAFASEIKEVNVPAFTPKAITGTVTIDGQAVFGQQLTAVTTAVEPNSINFTYQWQRSGDDGGYTDIGGATEKTYTLTVADVGKTIQVVVTADDPDYTGSLTSTATGEVQKATITGIEVTAKDNLKYTGSPLELVTVSGNEVSDTIEYKVEKKGDSDSYSVVGSTNSATDAGTYKVTVTVQREGYEDHVSDGTEVTIAKAESSATAPTAKKDLTYTGVAQQLIDDAGTATGGTMKYYVGESAPSDESQWEADVTQITGTNAQTYTVWYKVAGDANHNDTAAQSITATIHKAAPGVTPPTALELTYTGEAQALAEAGSTDDGTMTYSDSQGGTYSDSIPQGTEAKTYEVWYKVTGDANHTDAAPAKIDVTIAQATPMVTVSARSVGETPTYGSAITLTAEVTANEIAEDKLTGTVQFQVGEAVAVENGTATLTIEGADTALQKQLFGETGTSTVTAQYSGNTNIAKGSGEKTVTVTPKTLTYTVTAAGRPYNGESTIDVTLTPQDLVAGDDVTLTATGTLSAADAETYDTVALSHINKTGLDVQYYSVEETDPDATIQGGVTISPRVVTLAWTLDGGATFTVDYTGAAHTPAATVSNKALDGDDVTVTVQVKSDGDDGADEAIEVGDYTATALTGAAQGNYTLVGCANTTQTFTIQKVMATVTTEPQANADLTYTGTAQALVAAGTPTGGTMVYTLGTSATDAPGEGYELAIPTGTNAGTYYVWWKVQGDVDHKDTAPACVTVTIAQAAATVTAPTANADLTYTGAPQELIAAGKVESAVEGCGTMQYSLEAEGDFAADLPTGTDAKTYTVYWKVDGADETNYAYSGEISGQVTVTIAQAESSATAPEAKALTYTGEAQALVKAGTATGGAMMYALGDATQATADYSAALPEGTGAGTYYVWYYVAGDANHNDTAPDKVEVTIAQAAPTVTAPTAKELTYTGEPQALIAAGSATGGAMKYALGDAAPADDDQWVTDAAQLTGTAAGTYTVWYKVTGDANHTNAEPAQVEVTIAKADPEVTPPEANAGLIYTGDAQALVTAGAANGGTMRYSLDGSAYSAHIPTGTGAKAYTVWYKVVGDENHNDSEPAQVTVTIAKAQALVTTPPTPVTATYTGEAIALVSGGEANFGTLVYSLSEAGPFTDEVPAETEAGRYTVYYKVEGTENWDASEVGSVQAAIRKAASSATPPAAKEGLTYTGAAQPLVTAGQTADGAEVYVLGDNATDAPGEGYELAVPTGTNAGTYYVWWKVQGDIDHSDTAPACVTVTIAPAALSFEPVAVETPYTGAAIFVPVAQTAGQTPAVDPEKLAVSYEQDGVAVEPILPGTYDVLVNLTDPNFTLVGTAKVGTLTITHVHVYAEEWAHDESNHWHVCQGVGECDAPQSGLAAHQLTWVDDGDGTGHQACSVCGYTTGEHTHASDTWRVDEATGHYKTCDTCGAAFDRADHTLNWVDDGDGTGHQTCAVCGYTTGEHTHASETWRVDEAGGHYKACDACGAAFDRADHQLTWVDDGDGTGHQACAVCGYTTGEHVHAWDEGVVTQAPTAEAEGSRRYTCSVCGATKSEPISKLDTFQISGLVTDHAGNPLAGVAVRLTQGHDTVAEVVTDDQGRYSFSSVPAGLYNVAATWEEVTKTILVELSDTDAHQRDIQMPEGKTTSVVEVLGEDTPDVVVGGVDAVAEAEAAAPDEVVTVTLTVAKEEEPASKDEIDRLVTGQKDDVLYLDLSLLKQVNTQPSQAITDTGVRVLEIVVPYDFSEKRSVTVYRKHGDNPAAALTALSAQPDLAEAEDGTFFADRENGRIAIYASKFSTYAIAYQAEATASTGTSGVTRYVLTATAGEGGAIDPAGAVRVRRGDSQSYAIRPEAGFEVTDVLVDGASVGAVTAYTFENVTSAHTIQAVFQKAGADALSFTDVDPGDWFYDSVRDVYQRGLMQGVDAATFAPGQSTTRAMVVTILWRLAGEPGAPRNIAFADVAPGLWYTDAISWAAANGIVEGYSQDTFGPDDPITREQLAVMLWRYAAAQGQDVSVGEDTNLLSYQDADQIGDWAFSGLQWAAGSGVLQGTGSGATLSPKATATRAELATVLARYLGRK